MLKISVINAQGEVVASADSGGTDCPAGNPGGTSEAAVGANGTFGGAGAYDTVTLVYGREYKPGDTITLDTGEAPVYCDIRPEDTMLPARVFIPSGRACFRIPFGELKKGYSPKSFTGECHVIQARCLNPDTVFERCDLAHNPYDQAEYTGMYPHAKANVETRGEAVFAARNTVDGVSISGGHGDYPYHSWGINRRKDACIRVYFGRLVILDELRLTLRADFPHDNYWTRATAAFSDGTEQTLELKKSGQPQSFPIDKKSVSWVELKDLIPSNDPSPFPALTQFEVFGVPEIYNMEQFMNIERKISDVSKKRQL